MEEILYEDELDEGVGNTIEDPDEDINEISMFKEMIEKTAQNNFLENKK